MKTTLVIEDGLLARLDEEAGRTGLTPSGLVEMALKRFLESAQVSTERASLPRIHVGGALVDVADREALYQAMEAP